jgi:hypothetical protein
MNLSKQLKHSVLQAPKKPKTGKQAAYRASAEDLHLFVAEADSETPISSYRAYPAFCFLFFVLTKK